tara:strand:+ start:1368 stop:1595 length:228 start_codon:yes stop_codon:yes gene_type:complete
MYKDNDDIKEELSALFSRLDQREKEVFLEEMIKEHDMFHVSDDFLVRFYDRIHSHFRLPKYIHKEEIDAFLNDTE